MPTYNININNSVPLENLKNNFYLLPNQVELDQQ